MSIHVSTLRCGMTLLVEPNPAVRSLSLSWLLPGGFTEDPESRMGQQRKSRGRPAGRFKKCG